MRVNDTTEAFFQLHDADEGFDLKEYHRMFPNVFHTYFQGYCLKTDERMVTTNKRYAEDYSKIKKVRALLPDVIEKATAKCETYFGFSIDIPVHLFIGLYASNAFVDHHSAIYLAIEKLYPDPALLEVIFTHEIIHSYHNHILDHAGIEWTAIDWADVRNSIYREGIATYFSQIIATGHSESVYYTYDYHGGASLEFYKMHFKKIVKTFLTDFENKTIDMEREWLRLSGGEHFGHNRMGYFLGTAFVTDLCKTLPDSDVLVLLAENEVTTEIDRWIGRIVNGIIR